MKNYIKADLYRIFSRIPRWILFSLVVFVIGVVFWPDSKSESTILDLVDILETVLKFSPVYLGFIEMIYIFGDDFAGKTAQIAIGTGVKRNEVIFAKWLETIIVVGIDIVTIVVVSLVLSLVRTKGIPAELVLDIFAHILVSIFATGGFMALVFPIMFSMQNITLAFLIYILLSAGAINKILGYVANIKEIRFLHINKFTLSNYLNIFRSRMILGSFHIVSFIGICIYLILALGITCLLYKKRELEF